MTHENIAGILTALISIQLRQCMITIIELTYINNRQNKICMTKIMMKCSG